MNATLVVGAAPVDGSDRFYRALLSSAAHVVAADGAGEWCVRQGRVPDVVVGDFDSALEGAESRLARHGARVESHPADKDLTDLELAVDVALRDWELPVCLTAAFTGRIDHTLAAVGLLTRAGDAARIIEPGWRAWACTPSRPLSLQLLAGTTFSVVAVESCRGVTVTGGRWELDAQAIEPLSGRGVSNIALEAEVSVSLEQGRLLVIASHDDTA